MAAREVVRRRERLAVGTVWTLLRDCGCAERTADSDAVKRAWLPPELARYDGSISVRDHERQHAENLNRPASGALTWGGCGVDQKRNRLSACLRMLAQGPDGAHGGPFRSRLHAVGKDGDTFVILLAGGTKQRQDKDIADAHQRWADYKKRKAQET